MFLITGGLNILVLHRLGDPQTWRESVVEKELCLPRFAPEHQYLVHDFWMPLPTYVQGIAFDAIVLTQTFVGARVDPAWRARMRHQYAALLKSDKFKMALPQDDYTCCQILDEWLVDWGVDLNYPVCVSDWEVLYPNYSKVGRNKQGFTSYINDGLLQRTTTRKRMPIRDIDVAYRAATLSPAFGRMGLVKTEFGERFRQASQALNLSLDISTRPQDTILGKRWYDFVENTRCMLGVNSGSSLLDKDGSIPARIATFLRKHPKASFDEVEDSCFPGQDGLYEFTAISPRNLECALFGTVQILAPGPYGGFIEPWEDYIPLEPDMSNIVEVAPLLRDHTYLQAMADRCREKILSYQALRYSNHVQDLIEEIRTNTRITDAERNNSIPLIKRYQEEVRLGGEAFWRKQRVKSRARQLLGDMGLRRGKYFVKDLFGA
jgi:hypothetical protein